MPNNKLRLFYQPDHHAKKEIDQQSNWYSFYYHYPPNRPVDLYTAAMDISTAPSQSHVLCLIFSAFILLVKNASYTLFKLSCNFWINYDLLRFSTLHQKSIIQSIKAMEIFQNAVPLFFLSVPLILLWWLFNAIHKIVRSLKEINETLIENNYRQ